MKKLGGNADVFENKGVVKKAIRKCLKTLGMEIDGLEGAIRKLLKTRERPVDCNDNVPLGARGKETQRTRRSRRGRQYPTPRVFCEKRLQALEKKRRRVQKERQEISRGGKLLKWCELELLLGERLARESGKSEADLAEVRQRKDLVGRWDTSWDIIPFG